MRKKQLNIMNELIKKELMTLHIICICYIQTARL